MDLAIGWAKGQGSGCLLFGELQKLQTRVGWAQ